MTRAALVLLVMTVLAACGADGAPTPPASGGTQTGVTVGGDARIGVVGGF
jgi:hypothetical protein